MSDDGYNDMEIDREEKGLSRSAYVEQAVRKSINRNTKLETIIDALTTAVAMSFVLMVLSGAWMAWTYFFASAAMTGDLYAALGLFGASALMTLGLPFVVEQLEERQAINRAKKVEV